jgi:hypothetical protein
MKIRMKIRIKIKIMIKIEIKTCDKDTLYLLLLVRFACFPFKSTTSSELLLKVLFFLRICVRIRIETW